MAYTPDEQLLTDKLETLIAAVEPVRTAMMERLRTQESATYDFHHYVELRQWVKRLTELEVDAMYLKAETR